MRVLLPETPVVSSAMVCITCLGLVLATYLAPMGIVYWRRWQWIKRGEWAIEPLFFLPALATVLLLNFGDLHRFELYELAAFLGTLMGLLVLMGGWILASDARDRQRQ